jgi:hypothetical protein
MDTPEKDEPYYEEATEANRSLVDGKDVELEFDEEKEDIYGRTLAYVYVDGIFVNLKLVQDGYARAYPFPPNVKYRDLFSQAEQEARSRCLGIWKSICDVDGDGVVGTSDLILVGSRLGEAGMGITGDINGDGQVNIVDLVIVGIHFGEEYGQPSEKSF